MPSRDFMFDVFDFIDDLLAFFPLDKVDWQAGTYDQYLYDLQKTVKDNYEKGNYQVAYFYAHLIFMSYVYYSIERAHLIWPEKVKDLYDLVNAYNDKPNIENHETLYDFSKIPEKEIFKVFYAVGLSVQKIQMLSGYVSNRNNYAHATGKGNISEADFFQNIETIKNNMDSLHQIFLPDLKALYIQYLLNHADSTYETVWDSVYDFTADNSMSLSDVSYLCNLGISGIRNENEEFKEKYRYAKKVHCAFIEYCIENIGTSDPDGFDDLRNEAYLFWRYENDAAAYIENELGISAYECVKDGGEFPVYDCPDCGADQLAFDAETGKGHCFACDTDFSNRELSFCSRCGSIMRSDEIDLCPNCCEDVMSED